MVVPTDFLGLRSWKQGDQKFQAWEQGKAGDLC